MADSIRILETVTLKAQANLGEEVEEMEFEAGTELPVLQEWKTGWLVKSEDGKLFNVKKELAQEV